MSEPKSVKDLADQKSSNLTFTTEVKGHNFDNNYTLKQFIENYKTVGFQASNLSLAIDEIKRMKNAKVFFGCTSNIISSGLRDTICYLAKHNKFRVFVTTGGGIEEDLIKCLKATVIGSFDIKGKQLRDNGYNRVGNLLIGNENYSMFEEWVSPIIKKLTEGYTKENPLILTPSKLIKILGKEINNEESVLYWCYKNNINVYSPAITDGSLGDILTFHNDREKIKLDIVEDIRDMNYESVFEAETGCIILGAGIVKHHILNANLFKNGADYVVLINNNNEFDGSDAGANIEESISWGKIKADNKAVKVFGDASIIFPLIVAGAFTDQ